MLNLPRQTLDKITKVLLRRQRQVDEQLESIEKDDPVLAPGVDEASESGTDSWKADVHGRMGAIKNEIGTYGKCENCGKDIEAERLEAMPTANLCISCSKKTSKK